MDNNELKHYGVLGMKWGVRRYQNKDGTRTAAGKRRVRETYGSGKGKSKDYKRAHKKESVKKLDDKELREKINRLQMETQYKRVKKEHKVSTRTLAYVTAIATTLGTMFTVYDKYKSIIDRGKKAVAGGKKPSNREIRKQNRKNIRDKNKGQINQKNEARIRKEIKAYDKKNPGFEKKFYERYDDIEMWDIYSPKELMD